MPKFKFSSPVRRVVDFQRDNLRREEEETRESRLAFKRTSAETFQASPFDPPPTFPRAAFAWERESPPSERWVSAPPARAFRRSADAHPEQPRSCDCDVARAARSRDRHRS